MHTGPFAEPCPLDSQRARARAVLRGLALVASIGGCMQAPDEIDDDADVPRAGGPSHAEDVLDAAQIAVTARYPLRVADSLAGHAECTAHDPAKLPELLDYLAAMDAQDFRAAVGALAALQTRMYCLGLPGMTGLDLTIGEAMVAAMALPVAERNRTIVALFNPAMLVVDRLAFTRRSHIAVVMRVYQSEVAAALATYPTDAVGVLVLRPATGSLVRLPSVTCSASSCLPSERQMAAMFTDPRRFGIGACNWLYLSHNEWVCTAGLPCGSPQLDGLEPAEAGGPRHEAFGRVVADGETLRFRSPAAPWLLEHVDRSRTLAKIAPTALEKALAPVRTVDGLQMVLRSGDAEVPGRVHDVFGVDYHDADFQGMCGGVLEPPYMPWMTPPYDLFECLLDARKAYEASVDCVGQGNAVILDAMQVIGFDGGGGSGVLDPGCHTNPLGDGEDEPLAPPIHFTCEDLPEFCEGNGSDPEPDTSDAGSLTDNERAAARTDAQLARAQARNDSQVASDLANAKASERSAVDLLAAIEYGATAPISIGDYNFGGDCLGAAACYDSASHTIYVDTDALRTFPASQVLGGIVHEIMHAAMTYMGIPRARHHLYNDRWGRGEVDFDETEGAIEVPKPHNRMPAPDGNDCSVFARAMDATLECIEHLHQPGRPEVDDFAPWKDPRVVYPDPEADSGATIECGEYMVGGDDGGGSSTSPCNVMHCVDPDNCWCADGGLPAIQLGGDLSRACGHFTDCGADYQLDPVTCMCVPIGGLPAPVLPDNPLGTMWAAIGERIADKTSAGATLFPPRKHAPAGLFPG
jgi:hypothetical protein